MIRTSKHILKFQTNKKSNLLNNIFDDYKSDLQLYINQILSGQLKLEKFSSDTKNIPGIIKHSVWKQIIYKNASEIIRSQIKKANSRRYQKYKKLYAKCIKSGKHFSFTSKRFGELKFKPILQSKYFTKPDIKNISITLDSRLIDFKPSNYFNEFIRISSPYFQETKKRSIKLCLPIKYHKHSNKFKSWTRANSVWLTLKNGNKFIEFIYEKPNPDIKPQGTSLGIDQGYKKLLSCSNGQIYGKHLEQIYKKLSNKVQGSNKFKKLLKFRTDQINQVINTFFKENNQLSQLFIEDLKNVKKNSKLFHTVMNKMQRWLYSNVISKLEQSCQENGIFLTKVNPAYTSQTCSNCGTVDKDSRNGEKYHCLHCKYEQDADINAALNIHRLGIMYPSTQKSKNNSYINT